MKSILAFKLFLSFWFVSENNQPILTNESTEKTTHQQPVSYTKIWNKVASLDILYKEKNINVDEIGLNVNKNPSLPASRIVMISQLDKYILIAFLIIASFIFFVCIHLIHSAYSLEIDFTTSDFIQRITEELERQKNFKLY